MARLGDPKSLLMPTSLNWDRKAESNYGIAGHKYRKMAKRKRRHPHGKQGGQAWFRAKLRTPNAYSSLDIAKRLR